MSRSWPRITDGQPSEADERDRLERLCRYVMRPPLAAGKLQMVDEDTLAFTLKTPFSDGTTHLLLAPLDSVPSRPLPTPRHTPGRPPQTLPRCSKALLFFLSAILPIRYPLSAIRYPNVLYCMNNEIGEPPEWGQYWATFIRDRAEKAGKNVFLADMRRNSNFESAEQVNLLHDRAHYDFFEISQNNANDDQRHYDHTIHIRSQVADNPIPINNVKIYGVDIGRWTSSVEEGTRRFWRKAFGGAVTRDASAAQGPLQVRWLDVSRSRWQEPRSVQGGGQLDLHAPGEGHWAVLVQAQ